MRHFSLLIESLRMVHVRGEKTMFLFWRLIAAHLMGDFLFQSNKLAHWKQQSWKGVLVHSSIVMVVSVLFTVDYIATLFPWLIVLWISHFAIDQIKMMILKRKPSWDTIVCFSIDQMLHLVVAYAISMHCASVMLLPPSETWMMIFACIAFLTYPMTITLYYFDRWLDNNAVLERSEKLYGTFERVAIAGCFLLPGIAWLLCIVFFVKRWILFKHKLMRFNRVHAIGSCLSAVGIGIVLRMFFYPL